MDAHIRSGTVYRSLEQLSDRSNLLHVKVPGPDRCDSRLEYHCHIVCKNCGAVSDIPLDDPYRMDQEVKEETGFEADSHRTIFEGLCDACQAAGNGAKE